MLYASNSCPIVSSSTLGLLHFPYPYPYPFSLISLCSRPDLSPQLFNTQCNATEYPQRYATRVKFKCCPSPRTQILSGICAMPCNAIPCHADHHHPTIEAVGISRPPTRLACRL